MFAAREPVAAVGAAAVPARGFRRPGLGQRRGVDGPRGQDRDPLGVPAIRAARAGRAHRSVCEYFKSRFQLLSFSIVFFDRIEALNS